VETKLRVELLSHTESALELIYSSARQCYSSDDSADIFARSKYMPDEEMEKLVRKVLSSGHDSVCECVSFSFAISGISRACSHQLVRHRVGCSYAQQSQRYVKADHFGFEYVLPPSVAASDSRATEEFGDYVISKSAENAFNMAMDAARSAYESLVALGIPAEDARFVLPNACATKIVVTMNARALLHFFEERCCTSAQWEIRAMAKAMLNICKDKLPVVFERAGPKCVRQGYCNEGKKGCGRFPLRGE
jgi:thymidylate synthase (FAD)